jgi:hypothetical protein
VVKKELINIRPLLATQKMIKTAAADMPRKEKQYHWERIVYKYGVYLRCHVHDGILKVAFFLTEHMRAGGRNPVYELYISKEKKQFITFDRLHNKWRTSKLDLIDWPEYVRLANDKWISRSDSDIIKNYLGGKTGGMQDLLEFQMEIRLEELLKRHKKETDVWDADLAPIKTLPKDWNHWVDKVGIRQNYIFYNYSRKGAVVGYCTFCGKDVPIKHPRYDTEKQCLRCRHTVTFKSVGKAGFVVTRRYPLYLIQRFRDGFIVRQFEGFRKYSDGQYETPECVCYEIRRSIYDKNGNALRAYYMGQYKRRETRWIISATCSPSYWGNQEGKVYGKTLPHLAVSELSRTGLIEMLKTDIIDPEKYLAVLNVVPALEKFAKAKLPRMVHECISNYSSFCNLLHNAKASSLTKMLGINNQELKRLRANNGGMRFLDWLRLENITGKLINDRDINWLCHEKIETRDIQFIQNKMSIVQICNYIRRQMSVYKGSSKEVITKWADYLSMAKRLKMDTDDEIIFRVNKLYQRHDELVERCHEKDIAIQAGQIADNFPCVDEICESIKEKYEFADDEYSILVPSRIEDILFEGRNLHHCIGNSDRYWERIERRETYVMFLRRTSDVSKAYYTLEVEPNGTIRQKRTMYDRQEPDIEDATVFLKKWQTTVSQRLTNEDRSLAEKSRVLRSQSYTQLRNDQVIIHTGALRGQLLVDVLLADLMESTG